MLMAKSKTLDFEGYACWFTHNQTVSTNDSVQQSNISLTGWYPEWTGFRWAV